MNQRQRILELVKNDTITVEQGLELMGALETPNELPNRPPMPPAPPAWKTGFSSAKVGRPLTSGSGQLSFDQIVQLGVHGVKPSYIEELRKAGLEDVPFNDLTKLIVHRIPVSYVLELRDLLTEHGFEPLGVDQIVKLGIHKIQPSCVLELLKTGAFNVNSPAAQNTNLEKQRTKLEAKLAKVDAKLERATTGVQRQNLTELREQLTDKLEELDADMTDALEVELEAEVNRDLDERRAKLAAKSSIGAPMSNPARLEEKLLKAEAKRERAPAKIERHGLADESDDEFEPHAPRANVQRWFEIRDFVNSSLPIAAQRQTLEEMMQDISADIGVATDEAERAALLDVHAQISAKLSQLAAP